MKKTILSLAVAGLMTATGCAHNTNAPDAALALGNTREPAEISVRLLDPGAEPRKALRYTVPEGAQERLYMLLWLGATATASDALAEVLLPPIALQVDIGPTKMEGGLLSYDLAVTDAQAILPDGATDEAREAVNAELGTLRNLRGKLAVDDRGITRKVDFSATEKLSRRMLTTLGNIRTSLISVPLPEEPVGVGARWETVRRLDMDGFLSEQHVMYTLAAADDQGAQLELSSHRSANPQNFAEGRLSAFQASGVGVVNLSFSRLSPFSEADSTSQMLVTDSSGERAQMRTRAFVRIGGEPVSPAAPK